MAKNTTSFNSINNISKLNFIIIKLKKLQLPNLIALISGNS